MRIHANPSKISRNALGGRETWVKFREVAGIFIVSFDRPSFAADSDMTVETPQETPEQLPESSVKTPEGSVKTRVKSSVKKFGKESSVKTGQEILALLATQRRMTIAELAARLHVTPRAVEKQIVQLRNTGQLLRIGGRKLGHWEVLK